METARGSGRGMDCSGGERERWNCLWNEFIRQIDGTELDGYSTVHFAVLASFWRAASDELCAACNFPETPRYIYIWSRMWTRACTSDAFVRLRFRTFEDSTDRGWKIFSRRWKPLGWSFPRHSNPDGIHFEIVFFFFLIKYKKNYSF